LYLRLPLVSSLLLLTIKCLQVQLRRVVQSIGDPDSDLYQWFEGSKLCSGPIESLVTLEDDREAIEIKVRGPPTSELACFYFVEELLGLIDQVELKIIKLILL
jgi:death-associated protein kinase